MDLVADEAMVADADIIIRSSDGVLFRTLKMLLSLASPVFKDMFDIPQPSQGLDDTENGLPIVDLTEKALTIKHLLSFYYPAVYSGKAETLSQVSALLEAANKYEMVVDTRTAAQLLRNPEFLEQEPLRVYALACQQSLEEVATLAANHMLRRPILEILEEEIFPELRSIDAGKLYLLLRYRKRCAEAAVEAAEEHTWIASHHVFFRCGGCTSAWEPDSDGKFDGDTTILSPPSRKHKYGFKLVVPVHRWWLEYMESTRVALQRSSYGQTVKDLERVGIAFAEAGKCSECRSKNVIADFREFVDEFANEVDRRNSDVQ